MAAGFLYAGQVCVAGSRVFVEESIREEFVEKLLKTMEAFTRDPLAQGTLVGPLSTKAQFDRVSSCLDIAREEGANV
ncbi:hypothetical protein GCM10023238_32430 [Streptomyces heliomycini]